MELQQIYTTLTREHWTEVIYFNRTVTVNFMHTYTSTKLLLCFSVLICLTLPLACWLWTSRGSYQLGIVVRYTCHCIIFHDTYVLWSSMSFNCPMHLCANFAYPLFHRSKLLLRTFSILCNSFTHIMVLLHGTFALYLYRASNRMVALILSSFNTISLETES